MLLKKFNVLIILFVFCFSSAIAFSFMSRETAQRTNTSSIDRNELGKRYLKLGNTYRESKDYANALKYLQMGQDIFNRQRNTNEMYWYAVSQEYLGYYYRDLNQLDNARALLSDAKRIFTEIIVQVDGSQFAINENVANKNMVQAKSSQNLKQTCPDFINRIDDFPFELNEIKSRIRTPRNIKSDSKHLPSRVQTPRVNINIVVNFSNRNLTDFPGNFTGNQIDNLIISYNLLQRFPERISSFLTLQVLDISHNQISQFPYLNNLSRLRHLNFSNNQLTEIDASIGALRSLRYLNLSNNPNLNYISNEIFNLQNLDLLDISNTALPRYFIDDLMAKLPNTNIIYSPTPTPAPTNNINFDFEDDWDDDDDWDDF